MPTGYGTAAGVSFIGLYVADTAQQQAYSRAAVSGSGIALNNLNTGARQGLIQLTSSDGITFDMPYFYATYLADSGTMQLHIVGSRGGNVVAEAVEDLQGGATARLVDMSTFAGLDELRITPIPLALPFGMDNAAVLSNPAPPPSPPPGPAPRCDRRLCVTSMWPGQLSFQHVLAWRRAPWR